MWKKVHDLCPIASPTHPIVDFEIAAINAFSQYFPVYRSPRLLQSSMSKYMAQGSTTRATAEYMQDAEFEKKVRMLPQHPLQHLLTFLNFSITFSYDYQLKLTIWHYILKLLTLVFILIFPPYVVTIIFPGNVEQPLYGSAWIT